MTACILIISAATGQPIGCVSPSEIVNMPDQWTRLMAAVEAAKKEKNQ